MIVRHLRFIRREPWPALESYAVSLFPTALPHLRWGMLMLLNSFFVAERRVAIPIVEIVWTTE